MNNQTYSIDNPRPIPDSIKDVIRYCIYTGRLIWLDSKQGRKTNKIEGTDSSGYIRLTYEGNTYQAHRVAWFIHYGTQPKTLDHVDNVRTNNALHNIRECTVQQNAWNRKTPCTNTSGCSGVSWHKSKSRWYAFINVNKKRKSLGYHTDIDDAITARRDAEQKYYKEFAPI